MSQVQGLSFRIKVGVRALPCNGGVIGIPREPKINT